MSALTTRTEAQVAQLFGVSTATVTRLRRKNLIIPDDKRHTFLYAPATVDGFLQENATGLHVPAPTVAQLEAGEDTLLTIEAVMARLNIVEGVARALVTSGDLGKIDIKTDRDKQGRVRIPASEVVYYEWRTGPERIIDAEGAASLLGLGVHKARLLIADHRDELEFDEFIGYGYHILRASFNKLLERFLRGATVEEWYRLTQDGKVKLLTIADVATRIGESKHFIMQYIAEGLPALRIGNFGHWRIPEAALALLPKKSGECYTTQRIAEIFGVPLWKAEMWLREKLLCQKPGIEHEQCPTYDCLLEFVEHNLVWHGTTPAAWLRSRHYNAEPLMELRDLYTWGVTPEVIDQALQDGSLRGIWLLNSIAEPKLYVTFGSARMFIWQRDHAYSRTTRQCLTLVA